MSLLGLATRTSLLLWLLFLSSCAAAEPDDEPNMIEFEFVNNQDVLARGAVLLESTLTNNRSQFKFLPWNTPFDESLSGRLLKVTEVMHEVSEN